MQSLQAYTHTHTHKFFMLPCTCHQVHHMCRDFTGRVHGYTCRRNRPTRRCIQLAVVGLGVVRSTFSGGRGGGGGGHSQMMCCVAGSLAPHVHYTTGCRWAQPPMVHVCIEYTDSRPQSVQSHQILSGKVCARQ